MEQPGFDRAHRALHDFGDFFQLVADAVDQFDHQPLVRRQPFHAFVEPIAQLAVVVVVGTGSVVFDRGGVVDGLAVMLAQAFQAAAVGDAHDPGRHLRIAAEVAGFLPGDPETVVDRFFDDVRAPGQARQEATEPPVISGVHGRQGVTVARSHAAQQHAVGRVTQGIGVSHRRGAAKVIGQCPSPGKRLRLDQNDLETLLSQGCRPVRPACAGCCCW